MQSFNPLHLCAAALLLAIAVDAAQAQQPPAGDKPHGPPAEALAACKGLKAGAACSFTSPRGAATGTCWAPEGKPLACKPTGMPERHGAGSAPK